MSRLFNDVFIAGCPANQWIVMALFAKYDDLPHRHSMRHAVRKALHSLKDHKEIITTIKQLTSLSGIKTVSLWSFIFDFVQHEKQLLVQEGREYITKAIQKKKSKNKNESSATSSVTPSKPTKTNRKYYVPEYKSGPWTILFIMARNRENGITVMTQDQIILQGQPYCRADLSRKHSEQTYTAWNGHKTLLDENLMQQHDNGYQLTDAGHALGLKLITIHKEEQQRTRKQMQNQSYDQSIPTTPVKCRKRKQLSSLTDYTSPPPIKRHKMNENEYPQTPPRTAARNSTNSLIAGHDIRIADDLDKIYDLNDTIFDDKTGMCYKMYLLIDKREHTRYSSKRIDFYEELRFETMVPVKQYTLPVGDFTYVLQSVTDGSIKLLPFIMERKTYTDLNKSICDGRYHSQKYRLDYVIKNKVLNGRKMFIIEGNRMCDDLDATGQKRVKQAMTSSEARDGYYIVHTKNKTDTMAFLINLFYMIRAWIDNVCTLGDLSADVNHNAFKFDELLDFNALNIEKEMEISARDQFIKFLMTIRDGNQNVDYKVAYKVTCTYATISDLNSSYEKCDTKEEEMMMIHDNVNMDNGAYVRKRMELNEVETPDNDILETIKTLKEMEPAVHDNNDTSHRTISKALSARIWRTFRAVDA
eukprot:289832_1